jgi:small subunit ribosomal protein S20
MAKRTASARKQARAGERREVRNKSVRSAVKTRIVKARRAIAEGADNASEIAVQAISGLDRAASKGVLHRNNAARRKSRLARALNLVAKGAPKPAAPAKGSGKATAGKKGGTTAKTAGKKPAPAKKTTAKK